MTTKKVIVLSGVSGSGKSTYARKLSNEVEPRIAFRDGGRYGDTCKVVSADNYFIKGYDIDGECVNKYVFDPSKLSAAHGLCFRQFIHALTRECDMYDLVIVDNCNTTVEEISPYMLAASAYGWDAEVHTLRVFNAAAIVGCAERNTHNVPFHSVSAQHVRLQNRRLPNWWKCVEIRAEF